MIGRQVRNEHAPIRQSIFDRDVPEPAPLTLLVEKQLVTLVPAPGPAGHMDQDPPAPPASYFLTGVPRVQPAPDLTRQGRLRPGPTAAVRSGHRGYASRRADTLSATATQSARSSHPDPHTQSHNAQRPTHNATTPNAQRHTPETPRRAESEAGGTKPRQGRLPLPLRRATGPTTYARTQNPTPQHPTLRRAESPEGAGGTKPRQGRLPLPLRRATGPTTYARPAPCGRAKIL